MGSCLRLSADGKYEYFLAYGAYDETSEGTWRVDGSDIVLDSAANDKPAGFAFKRLQAAKGDGYVVVVESKAGQPIQGVTDALEMTYGDTPIEELSGKPFHYARERE